MALKDIINSIEKDAAKQVAEVANQGKESLSVAQKEWQEKVQAKKDQVLSEWQLAVDKKISQSVMKLKADSQNKVLLEKQRFIDEVFEQSLKQLSGLPDKQYVELLVKLVKGLPQTDGTLHSVKGKSKQLKQAVSQAKSKYKVATEEVPGAGGFVLKAKDFSVDNRFANLLENKKDELRVEVGRVLFS